MSKRVLIIDDEEHIRRMMRITLEAAGYTVAEAHDGPDGLKLYGDGAAWDCVVLDQRMPGMDGLEVLRRIKERNRSSRVVMATAYASIELAVDAMKLGATDFVRKPMTPEVLRNAVSAALTKREVSRTDTTPELVESAGRIETVTMNGFTILDSLDDARQLPDERCFIVVDPQEIPHDAFVQISEEVQAYVERMTRRRLPVKSTFWTGEARRLLGEHLWSEGTVPSTKLVLREVSREKLLIAERWET